MDLVEINMEKKCILCIEDHEETRELLKHTLSGYALAFAVNYDDGLFLARLRYFDLYILDNWLPGESGIELCRRIREFDPYTPILFCSAAAYEHDRQKALSAGAQVYLTKPVDLGELEQVVKRLITDAQERAITALQAELAALRDELHIDSPRISRLAEAREKGFRAKEKNLRFKAKLAYLAAGGTRGDFARLWPAVFCDKVRASRIGDEV
jgi:DNA-binding response OmpR family regulator